MTSYRQFPKDLFSQFVNFLMIFFALGVPLGNILVFMPQLNRVAGILLIVLFVPVLLRFRLSIPPEVLLFGSFILWGAVSGLIVASDQGLLLSNIRVLVQLWGLVLAVAGFAAIRRDATASFTAMGISAVVIAGYALVTNDFQAPGETSLRVTSYLRNPNDFAFYALLGIVCLFYVWRIRRSALFNVILVVLIGVFSFVIIYSGARKSLASLLIFIGAWYWFAYRASERKTYRQMLILAVSLVGFYFLMDYVMTNTYMGARIMQLGDPEYLENYNRITLYEEGFEIIRKHPLTGVGLGNYAVYSSLRTEAHSDYIETLAGTGIIGALLYFPIYLILWLRLVRLEKSVTDALSRYQIGLFKAFVVALLAIGFAKPNYGNVLGWFTLSGVIGYSFGLERDSLSTEHDLGKIH